jgi:hypothetical protein
MGRVWGEYRKGIGTVWERHGKGIGKVWERYGTNDIVRKPGKDIM